MEDTQILALFFSRSEEAITALDQKYGALCKNLSFSIVNNHEDAEECVNDAYLGVWNAVPPAHPDPLSAYLLKIVRNLSVKRYRRNTAGKRNSRYTEALDELAGFLPSPDGIEEALNVKALGSLIEAFLDTLSQENRVIFVRRYWFSDSYADISARTGLSEKTVSVRLTRIRRNMKRFLTERGGFL